MQTRKMISALVAIVAVALLSTAAQAATKFTLYGTGGSKTSHSFTKDGLTLTATATANGNSAKVYQSVFGLGVNSHFLDNPQVDGLIKKETLWLTFDNTVSLAKLKFAFTDFIGKSNKVRLLDGQGDLIGDMTLSTNNQILGFKTLDLLGYDLKGEKFGLTVTDYDDSFKLKTLEAAVVPVPAAAPVGLAMMAGFAAIRRIRRRKQEAQMA